MQNIISPTGATTSIIRWDISDPGWLKRIDLTVYSSSITVICWYKERLAQLDKQNTVHTRFQKQAPDIKIPASDQRHNRTDFFTLTLSQWSIVGVCLSFSCIRKVMDYCQCHGIYQWSGVVMNLARCMKHLESVRVWAQVCGIRSDRERERLKLCVCHLTVSWTAVFFLFYTLE